METPRTNAVRAAFHGLPDPVLQNPLSDVYASLPAGQQRRVDAAVSEPLRVFPERQSFYRVFSPSGDDAETAASEYTVDIKYATSQTCTCNDFLYRLEARDGQMCKHIWKTQILIDIGMLPDAEAAPYEWLVSELETDAALLAGIAEHEPIETETARIQQLLSEVRDTHRIAVDYPRVCTDRADIYSAL